jgi:hypothetical protein
VTGCARSSRFFDVGNPQAASNAESAFSSIQCALGCCPKPESRIEDHSGLELPVPGGWSPIRTLSRFLSSVRLAVIRPELEKSRAFPSKKLDEYIGDFGELKRFRLDLSRLAGQE